MLFKISFSSTRGTNFNIINLKRLNNFIFATATVVYLIIIVFIIITLHKTFNYINYRLINQHFNCFNHPSTINATITIVGFILLYVLCIFKKLFYFTFSDWSKILFLLLFLLLLIVF